MSNKKPLKVLIFYGGDDSNVIRDNLINYLNEERVAEIIEREIVTKKATEEVSNLDKSIFQRVVSLIAEHDKCIAILSFDPRTKVDKSFGAPNVLFEIGCWIGRKSEKDILLIKNKDIEVISDLSGHIFVEYKEDLHESYIQTRILQFLKDDSNTTHPDKSNVISICRLKNNPAINEIINHVKNISEYDMDSYWRKMLDLLGNINNTCFPGESDLLSDTVDFKDMLRDYILLPSSQKERKLFSLQNNYISKISKYNGC